MNQSELRTVEPVTNHRPASEIREICSHDSQTGGPQLSRTRRQSSLSESSQYFRELVINNIEIFWPAHRARAKPQHRMWRWHQEWSKKWPAMKMSISQGTNIAASSLFMLSSCLWAGPFLCLSVLFTLVSAARVPLWAEDPHNHQGQDDSQEARSWSPDHQGSSDYRWARCLHEAYIIIVDRDEV